MCLVAQLCPTLCNPMNCSLVGYSLGGHKELGISKQQQQNNWRLVLMSVGTETMRPVIIWEGVWVRGGLQRGKTLPSTP